MISLWLAHIRRWLVRLIGRVWPDLGDWLAGELPAPWEDDDEGKPGP